MGEHDARGIKKVIKKSHHQRFQTPQFLVLFHAQRIAPSPFPLLACNCIQASVVKIKKRMMF
jgi:hypothetical protein